ncbi:MAG: cache domain-containing protein [Candidatus Aminicenantes bacterium]|nr:cache domain-containing protein [Candidatus Aminicenantes bacterium]
MLFPPFSLRTKIILNFLVIIIFGGLITLYFGSRLVKNTLTDQAQVKVRHDLDSARMVFDTKLKEIRDIVRLTAGKDQFQNYLSKENFEFLKRELNRVRSEYGLDFLTLTDHLGHVILRTRRIENIGDDQSADEMIRRALQGRLSAGAQVLSRDKLLLEGEDLADRAYMEFIPTPKAASQREILETSGMVIKSASPVMDENGTLLGVLYGGFLLNRDYEIVDRIKELVYKDEKYKGREIGTATIFQNDLRISTNVKNMEGKRAVGTRVSKEVNNAVLQEGKSWIDRAFVVTDWYITAYEPIRDIQDSIIGILYVGILEQPYIDKTNQVMLTFIFLATLSVVLLLIMLYFSTSRIIKPLTKMVVATQEIAKGDLSHKVEESSKDELGYLAISFNQMTANLRAANKKLVEWGKTLENKVDERTRELTKMQAHLVQSEKLASLGKLAAGIAHEINNPLGGILIYSHLLLEDTPNDSPCADNLKKIVKETSRCKDIVKGLLDFARPREPEMTHIDIHDILNKSLSIMEGQALFQNIKIKKHYGENLFSVVADSTQLQQVFMNIIINGAEAMDGNGTMQIQTSLDDDNKMLIIRFKDSGHGIKEKDLKRLFEPFFTTKEIGKGTGLGLAISYGIIRKHQGTIEVTSREGEGSEFTVKLPLPHQEKQ